MEAKDTLKFNLEELNELPNMGDLNRDVIKMLEAQAKISFPLGKQEGIKKVVEWIKEYSCLEKCDLDTEAYFNAYRWIGDEEWHDQLKEWGIDG